jgi:hypothetical protein
MKKTVLATLASIALTSLSSTAFALPPNTPVVKPVLPPKPPAAKNTPAAGVQLPSKLPAAGYTPQERREARAQGVRLPPKPPASTKFKPVDAATRQENKMAAQKTFGALVNPGAAGINAERRKENKAIRERSSR